MTIRQAIRASLVLPAALLLLAAGCIHPRKDRLALVGATVIGDDGAPQPDAVIIIYQGHIETVAPHAGFKIPRSARVVDVTSRWIIPGLVDALARVDRWSVSRELAAGVTSVRQSGGEPDSTLALRDELNLGAVPGPRMFSSGPAVDGSPAAAPGMAVASDAVSARKAVDQAALVAADYVEGWAGLTPALLRPLLDESHRLNLRVSANLGLSDATTAAGLGLLVQEQLGGVPQSAAASPEPILAAFRRSYWDGWTAQEESWAGLDSAALAGVAARLAERRVFLVPALARHEIWGRLDDPTAVPASDLATVPAEVRGGWDAAAWMQQRGWTAADLDAFRRGRANQDLFVRAFVRAGGVLATGALGGDLQMVPGAAVHQEMERLVAAGLSPAQALQAATRNGAALLSADSLGRIAPGKVADLVILKADPLQDIRNARAVESVVLRGLLFDADSIRAGWQ